MDKPKVAIVIAIVALIAAMSFSGSIGGILTDKSIAIKALENQGFSDIEITNKIWLGVEYRGCSVNDVVKFNAVATNPIGKRVNIFVCAGWPFKGATIRSK